MTTSRWTPRLALLITLVTISGCGDARRPEPAATPAPGPRFFRGAAGPAGVTFEHRQSRGGKLAFLPETLGPGVASLDYDGDGAQDLFFVQGSGTTNGKDPATVPPSHLYRNDGTGDRFAEVGAESGAGTRGWGQGVVACDLNNDGYRDLVVTGYREPVKCLLNEGDGTFRTLSGERGLPADRRWWTSATALDLDRDGLLDLYFGAYVKFEEKDWEENPPMVEFSGMQMPRTLAPSPYDAQANAFVANRADHFEDRTAPLGLADANGRAMAALAADLDADGWTDIFVANDVSPCALFHNQKGKPADIASRAYVDESRGSMGLALGDVDQDGLFDIVVTHWVGDIPAVYRCVSARPGKLAYQDAAGTSGLGGLPRDLVGWGVGLTDVDRDGRDDLLMVNGHTNPVNPGELLAQQIGILMLGQDRGRFRLWLPAFGSVEEPFMRTRAGRSAAFTDLDSDGAPDVAVGNNNGPGEVWRHVGGGQWLGLDLVGTASSRDPVGARVKLTAGGVTRFKQLTSGASYFASSDPRVLFSLGEKAAPCDVEIWWPSGRHQVLSGLVPGKYHRVAEADRS